MTEQTEREVLEAFVLRRFEVEVSGYGSGVYLARTRGKAMADAWRSDAFSHLSFGEFIKVATCRLSRHQPTPNEITVSGKPALGLGHNGQYVQFVWPGGEVVLNSHPLDVLPEICRPKAYQAALAREGE